MDVSTMTTQTQIFLLWTLTAILLIWMAIFTLLALLSGGKKVAEPTEYTLPANPLPITPTPTALHVVTTQPSQLEASSNQPPSNTGTPSLR